MSEQQEKSAVKITVTYEDGSIKDLDKGLVFHLPENPEAGKVEITADMVGMSGRDLYIVVDATITLGEKLGMFRI